MKYAPEQVRSFLRQQSHTIGDDYNLLDTVLSKYLISRREYDGSGNFVTGAKPRGTYAQSYQGQMPMDVGGIDGYGKGKFGYGKGKGKFGKDFKGRGKGFGKHFKGFGKDKGKIGK